MKNKIEISVPVIVTKRKKYWVAYCPILKTYGYSDKDKGSALKDFDSAIETFFHVQNTLGILNQTLLNLGWKRKEKALTLPKINSHIAPFRQSSPVNRKINVPAFA